MTLLGWLGVRVHNRQDATEKRLGEHEKAVAEDYVKKNEFVDIIKDMRTERQKMHDENKETLTRIHQRIDDVWSRLN